MNAFFTPMVAALWPRIRSTALVKSPDSTNASGVSPWSPMLGAAALSAAAYASTISFQPSTDSHGIIGWLGTDSLRQGLSNYTLSGHGERTKYVLLNPGHSRHYHAVTSEVVRVIVFFGQYVALGQAH